MFKEERDDLLFNWYMIGNIEEGRPNMGPLMPVAVYRLMQFAMRDVLIRELGVAATDKIFYTAGRKAGHEFYRTQVGDCDTFDELVVKLTQLLKDLKIGILNIESANHQRGEYVLTIAEDLDCSGLPVTHESICVYDEGFLAAIFKDFTGQEHDVKEIDCWCTGEKICRFKAQIIKPQP